MTTLATRRLAALVAGLLLATAATVPGQTTLVLAPVADTYVQDIAPGGNFGASEQLLFGRGSGFGLGIIRTLVRFDLANLPHPNVQRARFRACEFYTEPAAGTIDCNVHRCTGAWDEDLATWSLQPTFDTKVWSTAKVGDGPWGWIEWDVTALVHSQAAGESPSLGWLFKVPFETAGISRLGYFRSREYVLDPAKRPELVVDLYDLDLVVAPLVAGQPAEVGVDRAEPGSAVLLAIDFTQTGLTPLVRWGVVLELHFPSALTVFTADAAGGVHALVNLPAAAAGTKFWLQAAAPGKLSNLAALVAP